MSNFESVLAFETALKESTELQEKFDAAKKRIIENKEAASDGEMLVKAAAELGYTLAMEELERAMAQAQEINDEELVQVAGGSANTPALADLESWITMSDPGTTCTSGFFFPSSTIPTFGSAGFQDISNASL